MAVKPLSRLDFCLWDFEFSTQFHTLLRGKSRRKIRLEVRKGEARLLALQQEVDHMSTPPPTNRSESAFLRRRAEQAWRMRWGGMLACAVARAFAASLLEQRSNVGGDADPPLISDVLSEFRHAGLGWQRSFDFVMSSLFFRVKKNLFMSSRKLQVSPFDALPGNFRLPTIDCSVPFIIPVSGLKILDLWILLDIFFYHRLQPVLIRSSLLMNFQNKSNSGLSFSDSRVLNLNKFSNMSSDRICHQQQKFRPMSNKIPEYDLFDGQLHAGPHSFATESLVPNDPEVLVDQQAFFSAAKETVLFLSFHFLQTDLFKAGTLDDSVQC